jgi:prolyl oligopeptidase
MPVFKHVRATAAALVLCGTTAAFAPPAPPPPPPPAAPIRNVVDTYHATKVDDPYRYMEDLKSPEVQAWIKAQADYADATLKRIPGREALLARIQQLDGAAPFRAGEIKRLESGGLLFTKRMPGERVAKLYLRDAGSEGSDAERILLDPDRLAEGENRAASLMFFVPSPDGKLIAYGVALAGSEQTTLRVLDVATGKDVPGLSIDRLEDAYNLPSWLPDNSGFTYVRRRDLPKDADPTEGYKLSAAYVHRLGTPVEKDVRVFAKDIAGGVSMNDSDFPNLDIVPGSNFAVAQVKRGDEPEISLYCAPLADAVAGKAAWAKICGVEDGVHAYAVHNNRVYLLTSHDAPRFKVVAVDLVKPDLAAAHGVVPPGETVVTGVSAGADALYVNIIDGGVMGAERVLYEEGSKPERIPGLPDAPSVAITADNPVLDGGIAWMSSWTRTAVNRVYDPVRRRLVDVGLSPVGPYDAPDGYVAEEVRVPSHDGALVPLSIVHKKDLAMDGSHPCLISGYGSYGTIDEPGFNPVSIAWLEKGGVLATAHVRGGGAFGKPWHEAGRMLNKPNTWKDFIACAQYLVDKKYTSKEKLAGMGGSAGGITIGRAITERPDLFAAAIDAVGLSDGVRMETTTNGVPNVVEFGSTKTTDGFKGLYEMSAYHHVKDGTAYPAVLLEHGINDPRVEPWMSCKMTARLQAANTGKRPILFRVDYAGGHGIGDTRPQRQQRRADEWAFLLWQFGEAGFQPED